MKHRNHNMFADFAHTLSLGKSTRRQVELRSEKNITEHNGHRPVDFAIDLLQTALLEEAQKADSAVNLGGEQEIKRSIDNIILTGMQSEVDLLRQHFTELEVKAEKAELEARNAEIPELRKKVASKIEAENARVMKMEQNYGRMRYTRLCSSQVRAIFKLSEDRKGCFLIVDETNKKSVSDNIRQRNGEKKLQRGSAKNQPQDLSDCYTTPSAFKVALEIVTPIASDHT
ncbi:unnamed protein product [Rhizophagus irregularis]|nr:unnamed protein product [Rhizophagus irregularis]